MIIGITGKKGSGKSSIADYIVDKYGYTQMSWADPLKATIYAFFGITPEQEYEMKNDPGIKVLLIDDSEQPIIHEQTLRKFEQVLGTEVGREIFGEDHWVNLLDDRYSYGENDNIVISDCRFPNEYNWIKNRDGIIINVVRPHLDDADMHESETHELGYDYQIKNTHNALSWLYGDVDAIMGLIALDYVG